MKNLSLKFTYLQCRRANKLRLKFILISGSTDSKKIYVIISPRRGEKKVAMDNLTMWVTCKSKIITQIKVITKISLYYDIRTPRPWHYKQCHHNHWTITFYRANDEILILVRNTCPSFEYIIQCAPEKKRKNINQVNFSENCNDLSEKS